MSDPAHSQSATALVDALKQHCTFLKDSEVDPACADRAAASLAETVQLLQHISLAMISQLEVLGRHNPRIKQMHEAITTQGLLDIEAAVTAALAPNETRITKLTNCSELMVRWWSALLAGIQSTVLAVPGELNEALNPAEWGVEKKMWKSEDAALWEHFKLAIRPELPLRLSDRLKTIQAQKSIDAFSAMAHPPQE